VEAEEQDSIDQERCASGFLSTINIIDEFRLPPKLACRLQHTTDKCIFTGSDF